MYSPQTYRLEGEQDPFLYLKFNSVDQLDQWVNEKVPQFSTHHLGLLKKLNDETEHDIHRQSSWFGDPSPQTLEELENHDQFLGMDLIPEVRKSVRPYLSKYLSIWNLEPVKRHKWTYNDKGVGVFDFSKAATGLYEAIPLNTDTPMDKVISQMSIALDRKEITTQTRKVFRAKTATPQNRPAIRIYLQAGGDSMINGNDMMYVGIGCSELVTFLEAQKIAVEVNVMIGTYYEHQHLSLITKVKSFNEPLKLNQLLLLSSDPRYFRYKGFKALIALCDHLDIDINNGLGQAYPETASLFARHAHGDSQTKAYGFGHSYSLDALAREMESIVKDYQQQTTKS